MDRGALDDALESGGRHGFGAFDIGDEVGQIIVDEFDKRGAQLVGIDGAGLHARDCVGLVDQRQQQMFQRGEFVRRAVGKRQRGVNCLFKCGRE